MKNLPYPQNRPYMLARMASIATSLFGRARRALLRLSIAYSCAMLTATTVFAKDEEEVTAGKDIWSWLEYALGDVYQKFLSVSTIAACVAASVCLIMMNFSTDDRAVATSRAWLKRILLSWVILNILGYIMTYLTHITSGGAYTATATPST